MASVPPQGGRKHPHQEFLQIDTTNILFICGGAFDGLDKIVESRTDGQSIGFNAEIHVKEEGQNVSELMKQALPQDFVKYGLIPEFVGRVPVSVTLDLLDEDALVRVLTEPKSAIIKQYKKLFQLDGVDLEFENEAVHEIAHRSFMRNTGARGLRSIVESVLIQCLHCHQMRQLRSVLLPKLLLMVRRLLSWFTVSRSFHLRRDRQRSHPARTAEKSHRIHKAAG